MRLKEEFRCTLIFTPEAGRTAVDLEAGRTPVDLEAGRTTVDHEAGRRAD